jgi:rod shape-determining protein MreD
MNYAMSARAQAEPNIEVHKFYGGAIAVVAFLALVLQAFLNKYGGWTGFVELPLLITIYFGLSRRNPATGLLLGTTIGVLQDAVSHAPIGLYGIAKTCVGYVASSIGARIDTEHPLARAALVFLFFHLHQIVLTMIERVLLGHPAPFFNFKLLIAALVNAGVALVLFPGLDRLRRR